LYGEGGKFKDTTGRSTTLLALPFLLELSAFAMGPALKISRATSFRCAMKRKVMHGKNILPLVSADASILPERVVTHWRRFSSGLWRVPEGDIQAAYCAETFPKIKVFMHEGRLFTNCGGHFSGAVRAAADCYLLIPADEYRGLEPAQYTYEGREAVYQGRIFKLGRKVVFSSSDPTVEEWRHLLCVLYADGGMFAHGVTYVEFLNERISPKSENEKAAHLMELTKSGSGSMPQTQSEMQRLLEGEETGSAQSTTQQMDFGL
jgi:hypothetical protein